MLQEGWHFSCERNCTPCMYHGCVPRHTMTLADPPSARGSQALKNVDLWKPFVALVKARSDAGPPAYPVLCLAVSTCPHCLLTPALLQHVDALPVLCLAVLLPPPRFPLPRATSGSPSPCGEMPSGTNGVSAVTRLHDRLQARQGAHRPDGQGQPDERRGRPASGGALPLKPHINILHPGLFA